MDDSIFDNNDIENAGSVKNGWNTWAKYVIMELRRLDGTDKEIVKNIQSLNRELIHEIKSAHTELKLDIEKKFDKITSATDDRLAEIETSIKEQNKEIERLKVKAGIWGAVAGLIPVIIGLVLEILMFASRK